MLTGGASGAEIKGVKRVQNNVGNKSLGELMTQAELGAHSL